MNENQGSNTKKAARASIPRWVVPFYWVLGLSLAHAAIPWGISFLSHRLGWIDGRPGAVNIYSLILVFIGLAIVVWTMVLHFARTAQRVNFERVPTYLLTQGPYRFSRNPMFLGELIIWLGWAFFFGSVAVLIAFLVLVLLINYRVVPREERELEARFGDSYVEYMKTVPRWFGIPRNQIEN